MTAAAFTERLAALSSPVGVGRVQDRFRTDSTFWGVRMGSVFALAGEFIDLPPPEIDTCCSATSTRCGWAR